MKILWCEEHGQPEAGEGLCWPVMVYGKEFPFLNPCRMVPMRLIPDNAETGIDREALAAALGPPEMFGTFTEGNVLIRRAARAWLALDGKTP